MAAEDLGSTPGRTNTRSLKTTENRVLALFHICRWLDCPLDEDKKKKKKKKKKKDRPRLTALLWDEKETLGT